MKPLGNHDPLATMLDPPQIKKNRSRSLDTEGVRLIQVKFAAMMKNRRKENRRSSHSQAEEPKGISPPFPVDENRGGSLVHGEERRRGSLFTPADDTRRVSFTGAELSRSADQSRRSSQVPIDQNRRGSHASDSLSPCRSPLSKMFGSVFRDSDFRRGSADDGVHHSLHVAAPTERRLSVPRTIPLNLKPQRTNSAKSSPSSPSAAVVMPPPRKIFLPANAVGFRTRIEERDKEAAFRLPPGTRKRTLSGGPGNQKPYDDFIKTNFHMSPGNGSPIPINIQGADSSTTSDEEDTDDFVDDDEEDEDEDDSDNEDKHEKGQLVRRHSMEPERKRNGSGSTFGHTYLRGEDPNQAAIIFRDCRGLPATAPFLENIKRSELEEDESQILVKFFKYHTSYDLIPTSAKLVIFDTRLQVKKAFYALVYNGVRAAPLWDAVRQEFVGMLTITDFIRILQSFYNSPNRKMEELEDHRLELWRTLLNDDVRKLISITPNECLYEAIKSLIHHKIHRLPVIDPTTGNVLYIITHKRILKFLFLYINELPKPSIMLKSLRELNIGTYENIETAKGDTLIIEALNKFVERRISALPIVDDEGKLIDIYAKFDVINLAAEGTYHNLDVTLHQANEYRNEWFEGVLKCNLDETMEMIMERIVRAEVHRLVVVDNNNKVIGIISLSDILNELVLKPCNDDPASILSKTVAQMESVLNGDQPEVTTPTPQHDSIPDIESTSPFDRLKTESEESVAKSWDGSDTDKKEGPSSSAESIDDTNKFDIDVNKITEAMGGQHEIGPVSG